MPSRPGAFVLALLAIGIAAPASAQSRAEQARAERAAKAAALQPYERNKVEAVLFRIEDRKLMERWLNAPRGLFLRFGGTPEGAGFAIGPAFRLSNPKVSLTGSSAVSVQGYWDLDAALVVPHLAGDHMYVRAGIRRRSTPQEDFFGLGPGSEESSQTSFALKDTQLAADVGFTPVDWFLVSARLMHRSPRVSSGNDSRFPSTEDVFTDADAPGLDEQPDFIRTGVTATFDFTDRALGPPAGGWYSVSYDSFSDRDLNRYSFRQWSVDLRQYVPLVAGARTLVFRGTATGTTPLAGHDVPFYLQPTLGGGYSLRGLQTYRYRDRNTLLLQAEYRFELNAFLTGALFYDAGAVAFRPRAFRLSELSQDVGFGLRVGFMSNVAMRASIVYGDRGLRLLFKFSDVF